MSTDNECFAKFGGHHKCIECGSVEIPMSSTDGGETGLTDYFFSCSKCDFSWFVAVRTDENENGASVGVNYLGNFYGEDE
jgi:hypothetical protein